MVNNRKFVLSDDLFQSFEMDIDLDVVETIEEIISLIVHKLFNVLRENKLDNLESILKKRDFHEHDYSFEDVLLSESNTIFYICSHC